MKFFINFNNIFNFRVMATLILFSYSEYLIERIIKNFSVEEKDQVIFFI